MEGSSRSGPPVQQTQIPIKEEDKKQCWVCFSTEDDDVNAQWVKPCKCKGTSQWVNTGVL